MNARQLRLYSAIAVNITAVVIMWALLLTGWFGVHARALCLEYGAPRAIVSYSGILCTGVIHGTEVAITLEQARENYEKYSR